MKKLAIILFALSVPLAVQPESAQPLDLAEGPLSPRPPVSIESPAPAPAPNADQPNQPSAQNENGAAESPADFSIPVPDETGRRQVACDPEHCHRVSLNKDSADKVSELMGKRAGQILVSAGEDGVDLEYEPLQPLRGYLRGVADREGRVSVEPVYIRQRAASPLFVKDVIAVSWSIYSWVREKIVYRHTKHYHGKVVYHPVSGKILLVSFVHRRYGDICSTLISRCEVIEYLDEKTFDLTLARRLKETRKSGKPVKVIFRATPAVLPKGELTVENLGAMSRSSRIYKWMAAARKTEKKPVVRERFLATPAAVGLVNVSILAYKMIRDLIMYRAARNSDAEVLYTGTESGGHIQSVVFIPAPGK